MYCKIVNSQKVAKIEAKPAEWPLQEFTAFPTFPTFLQCPVSQLIPDTTVSHLVFIKELF